MQQEHRALRPTTRTHIVFLAISMIASVNASTTVGAATSGAWDIHVHTVVKKSSPSTTRGLKTSIRIDYRYHDGIPPHQFFVAVASPQQAFPQTIGEYTEFEIAFADIYQVCPHQFTLIQEGKQTVARGSLTVQATLDFLATRNPGIPFQQLILHDWGNLYDELGGISLFDFGTSLADYVRSAGIAFQNGRCADASPEDCVNVLNALLRKREPTVEQLERNAHGGQSFITCPPFDQAMASSVIGIPDGS